MYITPCRFVRLSEKNISKPLAISEIVCYNKIYYYGVQNENI